MAEQLYFSRDSKLYLGFDSKLWEIPILDGFSFSQATNQSEISLSEMQGSDGLSRRGSRVFTDSLAPAEWSFSTYVRPYKRTSGEHHAVEEALWAVMAGADNYIDATTGLGLTNTAIAGGQTVASTSPALVATAGTYTIDGDSVGVTYSGAAEGWEIDVTIAGSAGSRTASAVVVSAGANFANGDTITIASSALGGGSGAAGTVVITVLAGGSNANLTSEGASFYRLVDADKNSTFGPAVMKNTATTAGSTINFGQSNRAVLGTCDLYFVMETSADNPMIYKLESAAFNEASIDFEVDGIATINWSGFAKQVKDMVSSDNGATAGEKAYVVSATNSGASATPAQIITAAKALTGARAADPDNGSIVFNKGFQNEVYLVTGTGGTDAVQAIDKAVNATTTFIRNRLTQLLCVTPDTTEFPSGTYNLTLTGGNITVSNNISYLVPEELGAVNVPIEHVTGGRTTNGSFTCYLTVDTDGVDKGTSVDLFNDMTTTDGGLDKVVNNFDVTFQVGGAVAGTPRLEVNIPKCHIDVPTHSIEDVISVETNFGAYTTDFNEANEVKLTYHGDTTNTIA